MGPCTDRVYTVHTCIYCFLIARSFGFSRRYRVRGTDALFMRTAQTPTTSVFTVFRGLCSRKRRACRVFRGVVEARTWRHRTHRSFRCFRDFAAENLVPAVVSAEHPCANHDNVHIRPYPLPQSIHVPTMIMSRPNNDNVQIRLHPFPHSIHGPSMTTSRSDTIHSHTASMGQAPNSKIFYFRCVDVLDFPMLQSLQMLRLPCNQNYCTASSFRRRA